MNLTEEQEAYQTLKNNLSSVSWRLNNLYYIINEKGLKVKFKLNWAQEQLLKNMHYMNIVLKARQLGFTTFIEIFMLDAALFNKDIRCGTIAHTLDDAKVIFRDKIKFPYDNLPDKIKAAVSIVNSNATELILSNNSSIRVGTSLRSGTLQYLHISEYGKICAKYPEKAREVRTGALNTVHSGQIVFIESTAEGQDGHFYEMCKEAQSVQRKADALSFLDFKFHFFAWFQNSEYELDPDRVVITKEYDKYFNDLEKNHGIILNERQKAWYVAKAKTQGADMKREFPSTPEEAFEASVEGAYYGDQIAQAELQGRIGDHNFIQGFPVHTAWDIGVGDYTAIWFFQKIHGKIGLIDYYENSGYGAPHYLEVLKSKADNGNWSYGDHWLPHDVAVREWGSGKSRIEQLVDGITEDGAKFSIKPKKVTNISVEDGINAVREIFPICYFNEKACNSGLNSLNNYRKEWDEKSGAWKNSPAKSWANHGSDAFRYLCVSYKEEIKQAIKPKGKDIHSITLNELWDFKKKRSGRL